jgi:hypothetical protein
MQRKGIEHAPYVPEIAHRVQNGPKMLQTCELSLRPSPQLSLTGHKKVWNSTKLSGSVWKCMKLAKTRVKMYKANQICTGGGLRPSYPLGRPKSPMILTDSAITPAKAQKLTPKAEFPESSCTTCSKLVEHGRKIAHTCTKMPEIAQTYLEKCKMGLNLVAAPLDAKNSCKTRPKNAVGKRQIVRSRDSVVPYLAPRAFSNGGERLHVRCRPSLHR